MRILKYIAIFVFLVFAIIFLRKETEQYQTISGKTMGTYYSIKIRTKTADSALPESVKKELEAINRQMSVFDQDSEISKINQTKAGEWIELSPEMSSVLKNAHYAYTLSNGSFDPTVGNLIDLWGFGPKKEKKVPSDEKIKQALQTSGFDKILFNEDFTKLKKLNSEVSINLSAIAKGHGVDRIAQLLKNKEYNNFVIEIGGEVVASGKKSDKNNGWNIGIIKPTDNYTQNAFIVTLKDIAVATSGNYRNFYYENGKMYSHTISPSTGKPVENSLISVTVFDETCMKADALTTSIMAMDDENMLEFVDKNEIAAIFFFQNTDGSIKLITSENAKKYLGK